jgi:hypothetical protein
MIVATAFGMFMPSLRRTGTVPDGDVRLLQVRSRRRIDLERLREHYLPELGETVVGGGTDYQFRAFCTHAQWGAALVKIASDINYVKFKDSPKQQWGDHALTNAYNRMWGNILDSFPEGSPYSQPWSVKSKAKSYHTHTSTKVSAQDFDTSLLRNTRGKKQWWEDLFPETERRWHDDEEPSTEQLELIDQELSDYDEISTLTKGPERLANGKLDHSDCDHANSNSARKRCRRRNKDV